MMTRQITMLCISLLLFSCLGFASYDTLPSGKSFMLEQGDTQKFSVTMTNTGDDTVYDDLVIVGVTPNTDVSVTFTDGAKQSLFIPKLAGPQVTSKEIMYTITVSESTSFGEYEYVILNENEEIVHTMLVVVKEPVVDVFMTQSLDVLNADLFSASLFEKTVQVTVGLLLGGITTVLAVIVIISFLLSGSFSGSSYPSRR